MLGLLVPSASAAQPAPASEIRQIVTFLFAPGKSQEAIGIYRTELAPRYREMPDLMRVRGYHEVESPEPLDLVVVTSYRGMRAMDRANEGLRRPGPAGRSVLDWYGALAAITQRHHDQFVEMIPAANPSPAVIEGGLTVFEYLRLVPGGEPAFLRSISEEPPGSGPVVSETGRLLVSDGWDVVRIHRIGSLGDWEDYLAARRRNPRAARWLDLVAARKTIIVREVADLAVR